MNIVILVQDPLLLSVLNAKKIVLDGMENANLAVVSLNILLIPLISILGCQRTLARLAQIFTIPSML